MAKIKAILTEEFKKEIMDFGSTICSQLAKEASEDLYKAAKNSMELFYSDYRPVRYKRTKGFLEKSYKRYYNNSRSKYYHGGVLLVPSPSRYFRNYNRPISLTGGDFTKMNLLDMIYEGHHGMAENFNASPIPIMNPSPYKLILKKQKDISNTLSNRSKVQSIMSSIAYNYYSTFKIV